MKMPPIRFGRASWRPEDRGFTLMELLLAMSILAIMVTLLMGAFRVGYRAWEKGDVVVADMQRLRAVMNLVRVQLSAALVAAPAAPEREARSDFQGTSTALRFASAHSLVPGTAFGQVLVNYRADIGPDGRWRLGFHEQPLLSWMDSTLSGDPAPEAYRELIGGLAAVRFEYLAMDPSTGEPAWSEHWDADTDGSLPALVRFWVQPDFQQAPMAVAVRLFFSAEE